jgi:hypothetical protein
MAKVALSKLNLKKEIDSKKIYINEVEIEVYQYVDTAVKSMIVQSAAWGSIAKNIVDEILLDAYLHILIIDYYTNITLTDKHRENLLQTFDLLQVNGIFEQIIPEMSAGEYDYLFNSTLALANKINQYNMSLAQVAEQFSNFSNMDPDIINSFKEEFQKINESNGGQTA